MQLLILNQLDSISQQDKKGNTNIKVLPFLKSSKQALLLAIIWTIVILLLTGLPGNSFPKVSKWMDVLQPDKFVHLGMFFPFVLLWQSYFFYKNMSATKSIVIVGVFGILYAILTEVLQHYVFIGRNANYPDAIADVIGVILGLIIFNIVRSRIV